MRLNAKQDRQGVRTAAELERKYKFEKQFKTFTDYAQDNRQNIANQGTTLQGEIVALERRTETLVSDTVKDYTPLTSFDNLSNHVNAVEQSLTNYTPKSDFDQLDSEVDSLNSSFSSHKSEFNTLKNKVDSLVDEGTSNGWFYRKWSSGRAECSKLLTHSTALSTEWGALYTGTATSRQTYPFTFAEKPTELVSLTAGSYQAFLYPEKNGNGVNGVSASACYNLCRPSSMTSATEFYISFYVVGRWK
jgi:hypothetical protein